MLVFEPLNFYPHTNYSWINYIIRLERNVKNGGTADYQSYSVIGSSIVNVKRPEVRQNNYRYEK